VSIEWFLAVVWFGSSPYPPLPSASCLSSSVFLCVADRACWLERGRGWVRSQIIRRRESLFLKNYSILSAPVCTRVLVEAFCWHATFLKQFFAITWKNRIQSNLILYLSSLCYIHIPKIRPHPHWSWGSGEPRRYKSKSQFEYLWWVTKHAIWAKIDKKFYRRCAMMPAVAFSFFSLTVILYCADTFYYSSRQIFYKWHKNASSVLATMEKGVGTIIC